MGTFWLPPFCAPSVITEVIQNSLRRYTMKLGVDYSYFSEIFITSPPFPILWERDVHLSATHFVEPMTQVLLISIYRQELIIVLSIHMSACH